MKTHDYTKRYWGHDYTFDPVEDNGQRGHMIGWGHGIKNRDYLIIRNGDGSSRYQVTKIKYMMDPPDMWSADVKFAPRTASQVEHYYRNKPTELASAI